MTTTDQEEPCVLYFFPFSLYSIFARMTAAFAAQHEPDKVPRIQLRMINLHADEHVAEWYLKLNPRGEVPCLTSPTLKAPLADSLDIAYWLCEQVPALLGGQHEQTVREMVKRLHSVHALPLSIFDVNRPKWANGMPSDAEGPLKKPDLSDEYRKALEFKLQHDRANYGHVLTDAHFEAAQDHVRVLLADITDLYRQHHGSGTWIFGDEVGPTVLDAYTATLLARLVDMKREHLIPEELRPYGDAISSGPAWESITHGRGTVWTRGMTPIHLLDPL